MKNRFLSIDSYFVKWLNSCVGKLNRKEKEVRIFTEKEAKKNEKEFSSSCSIIITRSLGGL